MQTHVCTVHYMVIQAARQLELGIRIIKVVMVKHGEGRKENTTT